MPLDQFWHLTSPASATRYAEWDDDMDIEQVVCPIDDGHRRGGKRLSNLSIVLQNRKVHDFEWTWHNECLIQDHVLELFQRFGITGFDVKPVNTRLKHSSEHKPPKLWELVVTGWAGMTPPESGIKLVKHCQGCGFLTYSGCEDTEKLIDVSQWDGNDFFMVWPLPGFIFVTNRVAQIIHDNGLTGSALKRPKELSLSGGFSPGRLSYWMPHERARRLGTALGIY
ncbi:hypothetical protein HED60_17435 [Planctomycetales bacterium ZRK34]|nr:hypothetical protein HED60_17435 [Planctomycetales bacterium ZRK34]